MDQGRGLERLARLLLRRQDVEELQLAAPEPLEDLLALDEALSKLAEKDRLKAELVKLRYFAALFEVTDLTNLTEPIRRMFPPDGTLIVHVEDPGLSVRIDGKKISTASTKREIRLFTLTMRRYGFRPASQVLLGKRPDLRPQLRSSPLFTNHPGYLVWC
jgi:hypothetical protein